MESTAALEISHLAFGAQFLVGLLGGASLLFLLFCLAFVGSNFFATRRKQSFSSSRHHLKLVLPHHRSSRASRVVSTAPSTTRRITL